MVRNRHSFRPLLCNLLEDRITPAGDPFTIVALPDTQRYAQFANLNWIFTAQTQWIVDNLETHNIEFVTGLGDIVQNGDNPTQWTVADAAYDILDGNLTTNPQGLVPYSVTIGNHDYMQTNVRSSGFDYYHQYFNSTRFAGRNWYGGQYLEKNHYQYFSAGGYDFLHVTIEWEATDDVLDWAREVIRRNPGMPTILSTHSYIYDVSQSRRITRQSSDGNSGESIFNKLVYPNPQIFMVLNGHFDSSAAAHRGEYHQVSQNVAGQPVFEMLSDYQEQEGQASGLLRLLRFDIPNIQIQVKSYSPTQNAYRSGPYSDFAFNVNFEERFAAHQPDAVRVSVFQEGFDGGFGVYSGTQDTQLRQASPGTSYGDDPSDLLVDWPDASNASHTLLRFDGIFGTGPGQVPPGSRILSATLTVDSNNQGAGGPIHRMVQNWNENSTWNSLGNGVQANNSEAKSSFASQAGVAALTPIVPARDAVTINVRDDVAAWAAGEPNRGWAFLPWPNGTDGWAFAPSESATPNLRPKLRIEWMPAAVNPNTRTQVFQQGVNGYSGAVDSYLEQIAPTTDYATAPKIFVDKADADNEQTSLLRFESLFGNGINQIRPDAEIEAAYLYLTTPYDNVNALGGGEAMNRPMLMWNATDTWANSFGGDGIQANNVEALAQPDWNTGSVDFGVIRLDVTKTLKAWQSGTPNYGWAFIANSTDGWQIASSEAEAVAQRPRLEVISFNPPPRVTSVSMNDGVAQRSRVESVTVEFSQEVFGFGGAPLSANDFELKRTDGVAATVQVSVQSVNGRTVVRLDNFAGAGAAFGSLIDGRWTLRALTSIRNSYSQQLDGNGDGLGGDEFLLIGTPANQFFRLFGDGNGDGTVDAGDFAGFGDDFGQSSSNSPFDFLGDGSVDGTDLAQFGARFGLTL